MKRIACICVATFLIGIVAFLEIGSAAPAPKDAFAPKWEYKTIRVYAHDKDLDETLNKLGEEGWEYAGFGGEAIPDRGVTKKSLLLFKRIKK